MTLLVVLCVSDYTILLLTLLVHQHTAIAYSVISPPRHQRPRLCHNLPLLHALQVPIPLATPAIVSHRLWWALSLSPPPPHPEALQHVFVGLYLQQICLATLFFLSQNTDRHPNAIPEGALMVVLIVITMSSSDPSRPTFMYTYSIRLRDSRLASI